jgi:hypothetical protein
MKLWGRTYTRTELLRRVGRLDQIAGVRLVALEDGLGRGVRVLEFRSGSGLAFDVLVDRAFDIGRCAFAGRSLDWMSGAGVVGPWYYEPREWGWFRAWGGGLLVTCGLDHTMSPATDTAEMYGQPHMFTEIDYGLHGRVGGLPARLIGYGDTWSGDECTLWAEGEVVQSAVFGEHLVLTRRIEISVGSSVIKLRDVVTNVGHVRTPHMLLYHCNLGFPLVDAGSELLVAAHQVTTDPWSSTEGYTTLTQPTPGFQEACFHHDVIADSDGRVEVAVVNRDIDLGVYQRFAKEQLPAFMVWRMMGEGTYSVALEPGTDRAVSREELRRSGELNELDPAESRTYELEIGVLDGSSAIDRFARGRASLSAV